MNVLRKLLCRLDLHDWGAPEIVRGGTWRVIRCTRPGCDGADWKALP